MAQNKTSQDFVPIQEVRDGVIILRDGSMRVILLASSLNFALKSVDEQNSILFQFQNFLNSLDFSVQIFVQSKKLDIRPYIVLLEERLKEQTSDLMKIQTREYIQFIKTFVDNTNIMSKSFFVIVPYTPPSIKVGENPIRGIFGKKKQNLVGTSSNFEEERTQLDQRVSVVEQGLTRCGIRMAQLGTEEVIELFYKIFNPGESEKPIKV